MVADAMFQLMLFVFRLGKGVFEAWLRQVCRRLRSHRSPSEFATEIEQLPPRHPSEAEANSASG